MPVLVAPLLRPEFFLVLILELMGGALFFMARVLSCRCQQRLLTSSFTARFSRKSQKKHGMFQPVQKATKVYLKIIRRVVYHPLDICQVLVNMSLLLAMLDRKSVV